MTKKKTYVRRPPLEPSAETRAMYREMLEKKCGTGAIDAVAIAGAIEAQVALLSLSASSGDEIAHRALVELAARLCNEVSDASCNEQQAADKIARKRGSWPILVSSHPQYKERNLRWLRVLPLGEDVIWKKAEPGKKSYDISTVPNMKVMLEIQNMSMHRQAINDQGCCRWDQETKELCELPELAADKETLDKWFRVLWNRILARGDPAKDKTLIPFGRAAAESKRDLYRRGSKSYESNLRQGIRAALQTAFRSITNYPKD
jgi:hypothetical protein